MKRTDAPGSINGLFVEQDVSTGQPPTEFDAVWFNLLQEELANVIEAAGIQLSAASDVQLLQAIQALAGRRRNQVVNGAFNVWQRGTSLTAPGAGVFTADRWHAYAGAAPVATPAVSRQAFAFDQTAVAGDPVYFLTFNHAQGNASGALPRLRNRIEDVRTLNGRLATLSFYAKLNTGAGLVTSMTMDTELVQHFGGGGSSDVVTSELSVSLTTSWQRFEILYNVPSIAGKTFGTAPHYLELAFVFPNATNYVADIADVQLELGNNASAFDRQSFDEDLAACQRYFEKSYELETAPGTATYLGAPGGEDSGTRAQQVLERFRVPKFAVPTLVWYSPDDGASGNVYWNGANRAVTSTVDPSRVTSGAPMIAASQPITTVFAHWTAEAELG